MLQSLRAVVEDAELPVLSAEPKPKDTTRNCPPGFKFDGKHCVPAKKGSKDSLPSKPGSSKSSALPKNDPPETRPDDDEDDFPHTRHSSQSPEDKDIPLVPDPEHEVMQRPHNAITYGNGKRSFEYADEEWKEYAHNAFIQAKFPDAFADKNEFVTAFLNGDQTMTDDWSQVKNSSAAEQEEGDYPSLFQKMWAFKGGDWDEKTKSTDSQQSKDEFKNFLDQLIEKADKEDEETTPPVILGLHQDPTTGKESTWLVAGNSRALIYAFIGKPCPTRVIPLKGRLLPDPTDDELHSTLWPSESSSEDPDEKEQNVRASVQNVIQARGAPQESVMRALRNIFETDSVGLPQRHQSGHTKRLFRKIYKELGYPIGTVRNWSRGKVVKTAKGWEEVPEGQKPPKPASAPVPAAEHDAPVKPRPPSPAGDEHKWIEAVPGLPKDTQAKHYAGFKKPKPYRQQLHNSILSKVFDKVPAPTAEDLKDKKPVAVMLMGGPASGKSTIGGAYPDDQFVHLDADAMKEHLPEYKAAVKWRAKNAAKMTHEESIHLMQQLREKTIAAKKNLVMDGTGRHLDSYLRMIKDLKREGYHVKVVMADIDPELAAKRAKIRETTKGRSVPSHVFDAAYNTVPRNFEEIAHAGDDFELWDTRPEGAPSLKWEKTAGEIKIHDPEFVKKFQAKHSRSPHRAAVKPAHESVAVEPGALTALKSIFTLN